jgi:hypothetical protein
LAEKLGAEFDAFLKLWRKRRGLAIIMIMGLLGVAIWSVVTNRIQARQIDKLEASLRESERENRGLRETVAPLLARAAKEFPGEEINTSLKKVVERLDADRPGNRLLSSASASVEVVVDSRSEGSIRYANQGGYIALGKASEALLVASSGESTERPLGTNVVLLRSVFQMAPDDRNVGKPVWNITNAEYIQIEFAAMRRDRHILGGKATLILNSSLRLEFEIPPQTANGQLIIVPNVQGALRSVLE